jgi:hypothetical protein
MRPLPKDETREDADAGLDVRRASGAELIPLMSSVPPERFDRQTLYEVVEPPFEVSLQEISSEVKTVGAPGLVIARGGAPDETIGFEQGKRVQIGGQTFEMAAVRSWGGLISEPRESGGATLALASVRLSGREWVEDIVAEEAAWIPLREDAAFRFQWAESEQAARAAGDSGPPGLEAARWGVEDEGVMNWFDAFVPGTGLELSDGSIVVLAEVRTASGEESAEKPALRFIVSEGGERRSVWIKANGASSDGRLRFEHPGLTKWLLMGHSWEDDRMVVHVYRDGALHETFDLKRGAVCALVKARLEFRLDQVRKSAVYLRREDSPLKAMALKGPGRLLQVRQGENLRIGNAYVRFAPAKQERDTAYALTIHREDGAEIPTLLDADDAFDVGPWRIQQAAGVAPPPDWAVLYVERLPESSRWVWEVGVAALGVAVILVAWSLRFLVRLQRRKRT